MEPLVLRKTVYENGLTYYSLWNHDTGLIFDRLFTTCNLATDKRGVAKYTKQGRSIKLSIDLKNEFQDVIKAQIILEI
jgi:hypothetical protein